MIETIDEIVLGTDLAQMSRISTWVHALAMQHDFSDKVQFGANLCLEEAVSNVIRHGYAGAQGQVRVSFRALGDARFVFTVEDQAPPFNPLQQELPPAIGPADPLALGGQGIRLMRSFAQTIEYARTPAGNRLQIGFSNGI